MLGYLSARYLPATKSPKCITTKSGNCRYCLWRLNNMPPQIERLGANITLLKLSDGGEILFSYDTPVAAYIVGRGRVKSKRYFSLTTSKHISQWLDGSKVCETVEHEELLRLTKEAR